MRAKICLIVEDDPRLARAVARILARAGWSTAHAPDTETALALSDGVDAILLDWQPMGPAVAAAAKRPIVVYTGEPGQAITELAKIGRSGLPVLCKPADAATLDRELSRAAGVGVCL